MRHTLIGVAVVLLATSMLAPVAVARHANHGGSEREFEVVTSFDPTAEEFPEGIAIDRWGSAYVTLGLPFFLPAGVGRIVKIEPDGTRHELGMFERAPAGIAVDARGRVVFNWPSPEAPDDNGVYRLFDDGSHVRLPGSEQVGIPNGVAFDRRGHVLVSDSAFGALWRMPVDGSSPAEPWLTDPLLAGCGMGTVGANGVALWKRSVYVANTSRGLLVRVPIQPDGSAGQAAIVAGDNSNACDPDPLWGMDGIAVDVRGDVYAALVLQNQLVRIDPSDGSHEVLLTADDGLHNPASVAFGAGRGTRRSLYVTNYAVLPPVPPASLGPAVLRVDVGVPGRPLP